MKIFVQIASYRDPELVNTIEDALSKASDSSKISFGICHQFGNDKWDTLEKYKKYSNFRVSAVPYFNSKGACWSRNITQALYAGEDFTLQIDSHTRFEDKWDEKFLSVYYNTKDPNAVITTYPSMFTPGQTYDQYNKDIYSCHVYSMKDGFISARPRKLEDKSNPVKAVSLAAGLIFGPGSIINDVRYDPNLYFTGEEASLAIRLFTSGYNLYHPNINLIYHYYTRKDEKKHWSDHKDHYKYTSRSHDRVRCLLGKNNKYNLGIYGLRDKRSIEDWRKYSGIDYVNCKLHKDVIENKFPPFVDNQELWVHQDQLNQK
jgi:hypothetical protein